jgi:hypothetical protein
MRDPARAKRCESKIYARMGRRVAISAGAQTLTLGERL